jgi:RimJ/RimL family protein N-acetyltransferase
MKIEMVPAGLPEFDACPRPLERGLALGFDHEPDGRGVVRNALETVERITRRHPWNSYWALCPADEVYVGIGAYKTEPDPQGAVEIAYFTFPRLEGRGIATQMVGHLARIATASGAKTLRALTLPRSSASTSILNRIGFRMIGTIDDPEDGAVWSWSLDLKGNCHER